MLILWFFHGIKKRKLDKVVNWKYSISSIWNLIVERKTKALKKWITALFAILIALAFAVTSAPALAKGDKVIAYKNCTELNKVYKGGVAQSANVKNKGGKTKYTPFVSKELYNKNSKLDRDKDLIACEK